MTICQINALRAARNAGLFVPKETVDACIRYVKQSQNPDGGFRYMLQGGASAFPRSAAGVVALQSAGEYDYEGGPRRHRLPPSVHPRDQAGQPVQPLFLRPLLCGPGDVAPRRRRLGGVVSRRSATSCSSRQSASGFWSDSICNEYGTAMALIILQIPNNYLPIFQR